MFKDFWSSNQNQINLSLYSLYHAEACNELAAPIYASLRLRYAVSFEEMSQRWRVFGNSVSDLTSQRFEPQTSRSREERVTARLTGRYFWSSNVFKFLCYKQRFAIFKFILWS